MAQLNLQPIELVIKNTKARVDILVCDANGDPVDATELTLTILTASGAVERVDQYLPTPNTLTGTVSVTAGTTTVTGVGTLFTSELDEGDSITFGAETHVVDTITNNTQLILRAVHVAGASGVSYVKESRIVKPPGTTGSYYFLYGDASAGPNTGTAGQTETNSRGDKLFQWSVVGSAGTEEVTQIQTLKVITAATARLIPYLRAFLDKSIKPFDDDPQTPCLLGYSNSHIIQYLEQGLQIINAYQPYPCWASLDDYPFDTYGHLLLEAALVAGVIAQQLYAIDTDIQFSDQGNTFNIQHGPQLANLLNQITARLDKAIPAMKLHFVNYGALHVQQGPNWRLNQLISASPQGSLFRNVWFHG